ncbi:MAG: GTPase Era [Thermoleophilaceae bacterium]
MTRSGFVALAGRPNAGKSTLVNRIVGEKVAIVSEKPQTTRREVRGIATTEEWQLVLVDLPGVQRPRDAMTDRMQRRVEQALGDADAVIFLVNGDQDVGAGDRYIARALRGSSTPAVTAVNKIDRLSPTQTAQALKAAADLDVPGDVFPISARKGTGIEPLVDHLVALLPQGPFLYPPRGAVRPGRERAAGGAGARAGAAPHPRGAAPRRGGRSPGGGRARRWAVARPGLSCGPRATPRRAF